MPGRTAVLVAALLGASLATAQRAAADPVVAAAGDIACQSTSPLFNGGLGTSTRCRQLHTSNLLIGRGLAAVLPLGDNQYCCGSLTSFLESYDLSWGRMKSITRPVPGAHEYSTPGAAGYFDYFNGPGQPSGPAGDRTKGYYSFDVGEWHLVALNSNCRQVDCTTGSAQERWLRADLARHRRTCTLAYMHAPRFSSTPGDSQPATRRLWEALDDAGADVVLSADAHNYERFAPQTPAGSADPAYGIRLFIVGTGGHSLHSFGVVKANSEARYSDGFGVLLLSLGAGSYQWRFEPEGASAFADSGWSACHGRRPVAQNPKPAERGLHCTIKGTAGEDVLRGTPRRDVICGLGGADTITAEGGDDVVLGGGGHDRLDGGTGRDRIYGGSGGDALHGVDGNDVLLGGSGKDVIVGGPGRDRLLGQDSADMLRGNAGRDVLLGGLGGDDIRAGAGGDRAYGNGGNDAIRGQSGADRLFGNGGRNRIFGNAGRDVLVSALGSRTGDRLHGGRGRDRGMADRRDRVRSIERLLRR